MDEITIPRESLEAMALRRAKGRDPRGGKELWDSLIEEARLDAIAMLKAWPGADVETFTAKILGERDYLILPLPKENDT